MPRRRNTRRRRRRGGLGALMRPLSVLLAAVAIVAALTLFFKVDHVEVSGNTRYTAEQIIAVSGVEPGDNLILFDKYSTSERIYTELPYITAVRINRRFPDTLLVEVTETQAAAAIHGADAWWMLGFSGGTELKILSAVEGDVPQDCLVLKGLEALEPQMGRPLRLTEESPVDPQRLVDLLEAMEAHGVLSKTTAANFSDPAVLGLWFDNRFRVELYYDANYDFKMSCLAETAARLESNEQGTIRMTMSDDNEVRFIPSGS